MNDCFVLPFGTSDDFSLISVMGSGSHELRGWELVSVLNEHLAGTALSILVVFAFAADSPFGHISQLYQQLGMMTVANTPRA